MNKVLGFIGIALSIGIFSIVYAAPESGTLNKPTGTISGYNESTDKFHPMAIDTSGKQNISITAIDGTVIQDTDHPSLVTTELDHWLAHVGSSYHATEFISVPASSVYYFTIRNTVSNGTHLRQFLFNSSAGDAKIELFEGVSVGTLGTEVTPRVTNRNFTDAAVEVEVFYNSSSVVTGVFLVGDYISANKKVGGSGGIAVEWILEQTTPYIIKYTNNAVAADALYFDFWILETGTL